MARIQGLLLRTDFKLLRDEFSDTGRLTPTTNQVKVSQGVSHKVEIETKYGLSL